MAGSLYVPSAEALGDYILRLEDKLRCFAEEENFKDFLFTVDYTN